MAVYIVWFRESGASFVPFNKNQSEARQRTKKTVIDHFVLR